MPTQTPRLRPLCASCNPQYHSLTVLPWFITALKEVVEHTTTCCHEDTEPPPLICSYRTRSPLENHLVVHGQLASLGLGGGGLGDERVERGGGQHGRRRHGQVERHH